jgi:ribosomal protein S18 acetylase RimI-like enzyme
MNNLLIRDVKPEDALGIATVLYEAWLETYPNKELGITREDIVDSYRNVFTEESIEKQKANLSKIPTNQKRVVAVLDDTVVGVATVIINEKDNQLRTMYVLPKFHGQGIGKALWNEVKSFLDPNKKIMLSVAVHTKNAIEFYKKLGFVDNGRRFVDETLFERRGIRIPEMEMEIGLHK